MMNLYYWIPKELTPENTAIQREPGPTAKRSGSLQDIPPPDYEEKVNYAVDAAMKEKLRMIEKDHHKNHDIFSYNDPKKFALAKKFIKNKNLIIYGVTALNLHLPKDAKIYTDQDVPDYDVYSSSPLNVTLHFGT